jgi:hypothetical protein
MSTQSPSPDTPSLESSSDVSQSGAEFYPGDDLKDGSDGSFNRQLVTIEAPPETTYQSYRLALEAVHGFSKSKGYDVSISKNIGQKNKSGVYHKKLLRCTLAGKSKNTRKLTDETRIRKNRGSKKTQCPMALKLVAEDPQNVDGGWKIVHAKDGNSCLHNHESTAAIGFPGHRRRARTERVNARIASAATASIKTSQILATIRSEFGAEEMLILRKDIDNELARLRKEATGARTVVEALFDDLKKLKFRFRYAVNDEDNSLEKLLIIHPKSIELLRRYPDVVLVDCTYKTNQYNLPLVNITAASGMNTSIQAGLAFIRSEAEASLSWVLENWKDITVNEGIKSPRILVTDRSKALIGVVEAAFPEAKGLICRWHQNKDVLAYCRRKIKSQFKDPETKKLMDHPDTLRCMDLYFSCLNAETLEVFNAGCQNMRSEFPVIASYLEREWWPWKEKCVACWTDSYTHFNQRLEGLPHVLKGWLKASGSDIFVFLRKALPMWEQLFTEPIFKEIDQDKLSIPYCLQDPFYDRVRRIIHRYPLLQADEQRAKARKEMKEEKDDPCGRPSVCKGSFRKRMGIPCSHDIRALLETNQGLTPQVFNRHWWIDRKSAPTEVQRPEHQNGAGVTGTRRDPLLSERVATPPPPPRQAIPCLPRPHFPPEQEGTLLQSQIQGILPQPFQYPSLQGGQHLPQYQGLPARQPPFPSEGGEFFRAPRPTTSWGYLPYPSFGTHEGSSAQARR